MSDNSSANAVIRAAIFSAVLEAVEAFRANSNGLPNVMLRDLAAVHANTAFTDLPDSVQKAIVESTNEAFRRLLKEGYVIQPKGMSNGNGNRPPRRNYNNSVPVEYKR